MGRSQTQHSLEKNEISPRTPVFLCLLLLNWTKTLILLVFWLGTECCKEIYTINAEKYSITCTCLRSLHHDLDIIMWISYNMFKKFVQKVIIQRYYFYISCPQHSFYALFVSSLWSFKSPLYSYECFCKLGWKRSNKWWRTIKVLQRFVYN